MISARILVTVVLAVGNHLRSLLADAVPDLDRGVGLYDDVDSAAGWSSSCASSASRRSRRRSASSPRSGTRKSSRRRRTSTSRRPSQSPARDARDRRLRAPTSIWISRAGLTWAAPSSDSDIIPLVRVLPQYPPQAMSRGIEGWVIVEFTISAAGTVKDPVVLESDPSVDLQPRDAARHPQVEVQAQDRGRRRQWSARACACARTSCWRRREGRRAQSAAGPARGSGTRGLLLASWSPPPRGRGLRRWGPRPQTPRSGATSPTASGPTRPSRLPMRRSPANGSMRRSR